MQNKIFFLFYRGEIRCFLPLRYRNGFIMKKITKKKVKFILKDNSKKYSFASIDIKNDLSFIFCPSFLTSGHTKIGKFNIRTYKKFEHTKQPTQEIPKGVHCSLHPNLENNPKRKQEFHIKK